MYVHFTSGHDNFSELKVKRKLVSLNELNEYIPKFIIYTFLVFLMNALTEFMLTVKMNASVKFFEKAKNL